MEALHTGMVVYRASRLEALLDPLEGLLAKYPPADLLGSQTVLAAHPGVKRWLGLALARQRGPKGIVANLEVCLPTAWFERRVREELGVSAIALAPYQREAMRWRIFDQLPTIDDDVVQRYLDAQDGRRRFQLADRFAGLLSRYMVYRPNWLAQWQRGVFDTPEPNLLAPLWQRIRADIGQPHRGELIAQLIERRRLAPISSLLAPLHVFGLSHLPPSELEVLRAESRHRLVVMYVPDPCIEFWAGLGNEPGDMARRLALGVGDAGERELLSLAHPLLSAWGRMGHHFGLRLHEGIGDVVLETRHGEDKDWVPESDGLLHRLQQGIRRMTDDLLPAMRLTAAEAMTDPSLRIHGCHTRVRELEVLHDVIRDALAQDQSLNPSDILVMSPTIAEYAPLVSSVFAGTRGEGRGLPFHLADVALRRTHPVLEAFSILLRMPVSRVSAPEVMDLLQVPAIARALGLNADGIDQLRNWLTEAHVAWGLDHATRSRFGLPEFSEHSFGWGMERLLAGYVFGGRASAEAAKDMGIWPVSGVDGMKVEVIGALDQLLCMIQRLSALAASDQPLSRWRDALQSAVQALFRADPANVAENEALLELEGMVESLLAGTSEQVDPQVDFAVVRDLLEERLDAVPERQPFLIGGITFSGMVPQRSIPFRMIALIGLNDGDFPRSASDGGIDLMSRYRELGDRDVRSDDRYLFLETVMAARSRLHLSFVSEGVRDGKPRNPSAPLAELMAYLDTCAGLSGSLRDTARPWFVQHPLQPFDPRYFDDTDPRLFSYESRFARMVRGSVGGGDRFARPAEADGVQALSALPESEVLVPLASVCGYFRKPAEHLLRRVLDLRLDALEGDALGDSEPLESRFSALERVPRGLVMDALLRDQFTLPDTPPDELRLSGRMPPGELGMQAYRSAREDAMALLAVAEADTDLGCGALARAPLDLAQRVGPFLIQGATQALYRVGESWLLLDVHPGKVEARLGFKEKVPLFIEWALLRLKYPDQPVRVVMLTVPDKDNDARFDDELNACATLLDADDLRQRIVRLLCLWHAARAGTHWYFPKTSWAIATAGDDVDKATAEDVWLGADHEHSHGEVDNEPGYEQVLTRGVDLFDGDDWANLSAIAHAVRECITVRKESGNE